ncbi:uncharacterized protein ACNLHF_017963 [Anomaloglossus baeobatrachus]|uniref:uncharacterized protein LOC142296286 n=1 Tax=Anomaloglossus baeobatrachus TaxID=238106 RepID=UPI003F4F88C6
MAPRVDTEKLISAVETHPPLWDTRVDGYHDRLTVDRHWLQVAEEVYPNNAWDRCSPSKRAKYVDLVKRRWRSARDQYRREYNPIPTSSSQGRKRRYVYYEQISFLAPILEVTQTEDNLDESDDQPTAGPSATATSASEQEPGREDSENPEIQQDAAAATESHDVPHIWYYYLSTQLESDGKERYLVFIVQILFEEIVASISQAPDMPDHQKPYK